LRKKSELNLGTESYGGTRTIRLAGRLLKIIWVSCSTLAIKNEKNKCLTIKRNKIDWTTKTLGFPARTFMNAQNSSNFFPGICIRAIKPICPIASFSMGYFQKAYSHFLHTWDIVEFRGRISTNDSTWVAYPWIFKTWRNLKRKRACSYFLRFTSNLCANTINNFVSVYLITPSTRKRYSEKSLRIGKIN
jgi:hypothetical protein